MQYEWIVSPLDIPPPPLPEPLLELYQERNFPNKSSVSKPRANSPRFPYRDNYDYLFRHFDLKHELERAGVEFITSKPDPNGNLSCYVPAILRNGKEDHHPSGIFNVFNGVLKDFSTGTNHLFFYTLATLTGRDWREIYREWDKRAGGVTGRPHSRRLAMPSQTPTETRKSLDEARRHLLEDFKVLLSRPPIPKRLNLIKGMPGLGKTYSLCRLLAEKQLPAIILTLENSLADHHLKILREHGGGAMRMPALEEYAICPFPNEYKATSRRGFQPSQSFPCRKCPIGPRNCPYLLAFSSLENADQLCCAAIYHTHETFYHSYGNENRQRVVFDENCIDLLLEPISATSDQWKAWGELLQQNRSPQLKSHTESLLTLVHWIQEAAKEFSLSEEKFQVHRLPEAIKKDLKPSPQLGRWLNRQGGKQEHRQLPNLHAAAMYLLNHGPALLFEKIGDQVVIRFRKKNALPEDKEVFVLDATADTQLLTVILPDWEIVERDCPSIEQQGKIIQIMDYDLSRNRIKKEVSKHSELNPSWLVQVLDQILEKHGPTPVITFKKVIDETDYQILRKVKHPERVLGPYNFPCRGHSFSQDALIVLGSPYKDESTIWELALAIWGEEGLPKNPYRRILRFSPEFVSETMGYGEPHLSGVEDFLVSAELVQGIGRVRPLQREVTIYVLTNYHVTDWKIRQVMASEIFEMRKVLRKDSWDNYKKYCDTAWSLLHEENAFANSTICREVGIAERTGRNYLRKLLQEYPNQLRKNGRKVEATTNFDICCFRDMAT